jgi:hypothetical protein
MKIAENSNQIPQKKWRPPASAIFQRQKLQIQMFGAGKANGETIAARHNHTISTLFHMQKSASFE